MVYANCSIRNELWVCNLNINAIDLERNALAL